MASIVALAAGCSPLLYALFSAGGDDEGPGRNLVVGQSVDGSTDDDQDTVTLSCGSPEGAGDESWTFVPPSAGTYRVTVNGQYDCAVGLFGPDDDRHEIACNDDTGGNNLSQVSSELEAGRRYAVVVDGYRSNEGAYRLTVELLGPAATPQVPGPQAPPVVPEDPAAMQARCAAAPQLAVGTTSGTLERTTATARTSCASGPGGDVVYQLQVQVPARVTIKLDATFDGILELRSGCSPGPVLACNDDTGDALHSMVSANLGPGTYYVIVDTYNERLAGPFSIQVLMETGGMGF
ncbi:MAG: hypothetical protein HYY06_10050 [Deltaproteobacteria bacterium]|nr:hypothetical protein [Deltaproteobacteria bacterium]